MHVVSLKDDLKGTAIKAGIAAFITLMLIMVCVIAECMSKYRIWSQLRKFQQQAFNPRQEEDEEKHAMADGEDGGDGGVKKV